MVTVSLKEHEIITLIQSLNSVKNLGPSESFIIYQTIKKIIKVVDRRALKVRLNQFLETFKRNNNIIDRTYKKGS